MSDDLEDDEIVTGKPGAVPLKRTAKQQALAAKQQAARDLAAAQTAQQQNAQRLAQVVNLMIAGYSFEAIGASIGASADEVERMLTNDTARYVKTQPSLRIFVRNWLSAKYTGLLDAVYEEATDRTHAEKLENQDRALRILKEMGRLHGAEAPVQSEVKVDVVPEAVEQMVQRLAAGAGQAYDDTIFDIVDAEVIHEAADEARLELERASREVGEPEEDDQDWGQG